MAFEDVGTLTALMQALCKAEADGHFPASNSASASSPARAISLKNWPLVMAAYEAMRIPRCTQIYRSSHSLGAMQLQRAGAVRHEKPRLDDLVYWDALQEEGDMALKKQVWRHNTLPVMWHGSDYNYLESTNRVLKTVFERIAKFRAVVPEAPKSRL